MNQSVHVCVCVLDLGDAAGGELFEQLSAKGYYRERDAAHIMRTVLQVCDAVPAFDLLTDCSV